MIAGLCCPWLIGPRSKSASRKSGRLVLVSIAIALHCSAVFLSTNNGSMRMAGVLWNSGVQPDPVYPNVVRIHGKLASLIGLVSVQSRNDTPTRICSGYFFDAGNTGNP